MSRHNLNNSFLVLRVLLVSMTSSNYPISTYWNDIELELNPEQEKNCHERDRAIISYKV